MSKAPNLNFCIQIPPYLDLTLQLKSWLREEDINFRAQTIHDSFAFSLMYIALSPLVQLLNQNQVTKEESNGNV
jgi:hypothetical protein